MLNYGMGRKTLKSYMIGLVLSLLFTVLAFGVVAYHVFSVGAIFVAVGILALMQLFAQVVFFLRVNASKDGRWGLMPFLFTILIVTVLFGGSLWIMYNLNYNMTH